jgi:hypothetical protein
MIIAQKDEYAKLPRIKASHPQSLSLKIIKGDYYDSTALNAYIQELSALPDFRYFLFFDKTPSQPFLGGSASSDFCRALEPAGWNAPVPVSPQLQNLSRLTW